MNYVHVEHNCQSEPDPYQELALGIIRQAAADYRYLRQHYSADSGCDPCLQHFCPDNRFRHTAVMDAGICQAKRYR